MITPIVKLKLARGFLLLVVIPMSSCSSKVTYACFKRLNLKVRLQDGVLNFKGDVFSRRSSRFDEAKVDPLYQPAGKDNSA